MTDSHAIVPVPASELQQLREDAARYRWLRENQIARQNYLCCEREKLDAAIDAARQQRREK